LVAECYDCHKTFIMSKPLRPPSDKAISYWFKMRPEHATKEYEYVKELRTVAGQYTIIRSSPHKDENLEQQKGFYQLKSSDKYDLGSFAFYDINAHDPYGTMDTSFLKSCKINNVRINGDKIQ